MRNRFSALSNAVRLNSDVTVMSSYVMYDIYSGETGWNFFFTTMKIRGTSCGAVYYILYYILAGHFVLKQRYGKQYFQVGTGKRMRKDKETAYHSSCKRNVVYK